MKQFIKFSLVLNEDADWLTQWVDYKFWEL